MLDVDGTNSNRFEQLSVQCTAKEPTKSDITCFPQSPRFTHHSSPRMNMISSFQFCYAYRCWHCKKHPIFSQAKIFFAIAFLRHAANNQRRNAILLTAHIDLHRHSPTRTISHPNHCRDLSARNRLAVQLERMCRG